MIADMWRSVDDEQLNALAEKLGSPWRKTAAGGKEEPRERELLMVTPLSRMDLLYLL